MRVYSIDDLPLKLHQRLKPHPSSPPNPKTADNARRDQFPVSSAAKKCGFEENRSNKRLEKQQLPRQNFSESEYDLHQLNPRRRLKPKDDANKAQQKKKQSETLQSRKRKRRSKYSSKNSAYNPKSSSKNLGSKSRQKEFPNPIMIRQRSEKIFSHKRVKKAPEPQRFVSATRIRYSKQIIKEIDLQREKEQQRQAEMDAVQGLQAKRLEKIHKIQRIKVQQKLQHLKKMQQSCTDNLPKGRSIC